MTKLAISILCVLFVRRFSSKRFVGDGDKFLRILAKMGFHDISNTLGFMVREMESLVVPCWNQWNPKFTVAKYRWIDHLGRSALRNFMVLHGDGTMEIRAAQSSDTGSYACIINVPGEEELQLHYGITGDFCITFDFFLRRSCFYSSVQTGQVLHGVSVHLLCARLQHAPNQAKEKRTSSSGLQ